MVMTFYIFEMNEYILSLSLCRTDVFVKPFQAECQVQINIQNQIIKIIESNS